MNESIINEMIQRVLFSTNEGAIIINSNRSIVFINKTAMEVLGYDKKEDVIGKDVTEAIPNTRLHIVLQRAMPEYDKLQYLKNTTIYTSRIPLFDVSGNIMGVAAIFRDITSVQKMAEEVTNLRQIEETLEAIINSTRDAISVADENGKIIMVNSEYSRITGLSAEEVVGRPATIDIANQDESKHMLVVKTRQPVLGRRMIAGRTKKEVIVDVTPLYVKDAFKGSVAVIHDVSEISNLMEELANARSLLRRTKGSFTFDDIKGESPRLRVAIEQAKRVAGTDATVLLRGEQGTGKELFAKAIHNCSARGDNPFVSVNCAAYEPGEIGTAVFGDMSEPSERASKKSLIEEAIGGTLFLDEIAILDKSSQAKLLDFMKSNDNGKTRNTDKHGYDLRIITATSENLEKMVEEGEFIENLYNRLGIVPIFIPPLRERPEDLQYLVYSILEKLNNDYRRDVKKVSDSVFELFKKYTWPGNVRELENILGRALIKAQPFVQELTLEHFDFLLPNLNEKILKKAGQRGTLKEAVARAEKQTIEESLFENRGNRAKAAKELGISLRSLYYKLERYGINIKSGGN